MRNCTGRNAPKCPRKKQLQGCYSALFPTKNYRCWYNRFCVSTQSRNSQLCTKRTPKNVCKLFRQHHVKEKAPKCVIYKGVWRPCRREIFWPNFETSPEQICPLCLAKQSQNSQKHSPNECTVNNNSKRAKFWEQHAPHMGLFLAKIWILGQTFD